MKTGLPIFFIFLIFACQPNKAIQSKDSQKVDSLFESYYQFKQQINPIESTKAGFTAYNDHLSNYISDPYQLQLINSYEQYHNAANSIDSTAISPAQWLSLAVLKWDCQIKKEGLTNPLVTIASPMYDLPSFELMPLLQVQSLHLYMAQLAAGKSVHPFHSVKDYENWLLRLDDYMIFLDTCMAKMEIGISKQVVLPKSLISKMIPQLDEFISNPAEKHLFFEPIYLLPDSIPAADREQLTEKYRWMITHKIQPKYRELQEFLIHEYLPMGRETSGLSNLPYGLETYQYLIRLHTTTHLSIDQIHALGKSEVARISKEMEQAKNQIGFKGDLKSFFEFIRNSPDQMPFIDPDQVIANFNLIKTRIDQSISTIFDLQPKADFEIRRTEAFREASASAEYVPGTKDATRSGIFYVPIPDVTRYNKYADESLFLHEAVPGHHYQLSLQQENQQLPEFLHPESMGVFVEGWALYAESLGKELGLYEDPFQYFGMLSMEMHRAIRLVVDTGIHGKGWTREQAIRYSLDHEAAAEPDIIAEIERYIATPGQALSYKIGQLKIRELRTKAEAALGDQFDIKEYHNQVLNSGSLPLVVLENKINSWIKAMMSN
jgi:uncharacterized protein (DUF885 family)